MIVARDVPALCRALASLPRLLALVPTMGALHDGYTALLRDGQRRAASTAASIFVSPLQFTASEDFDRYPHDEAADLDRLEAAGCGIAWLPSVDVTYRQDRAMSVEVGGPSEGFEGAACPSHFRGMATVVAKLLHQAVPDS